MRVIVFFDLPVVSKQDRREYSVFRRALLKNGFVMIQYSVYSRTVKNNDDATKYERIVAKIVPENGAVRLLTVTEKQYDSMILLCGEKMQQEILLDTSDILEL